MALDTILINLTDSLMGTAGTFNGPFYKVFFPACYCGGLLMGMRGLRLASKAAESGHQSGDVFKGAAASFIIGVLFIALPSLMSMMLHSTFGTSQISYLPTENIPDKISTVLMAVLTLIQALGWIAMVRGLLIMKKVGEGSHQHSMGTGMTHIGGAIACMNIVGIANLIKETVGGSLF